MICYKFISKDLLNRLKKSGVDSVDSFRCHWIQSFERRCLGSLMKPCTESGSSGSTGDMSQMNIHESENNFAGHLRPPTDEWRNDERIWTHMNASSLHFPMNTRRSFEAHNLSEAFAWPFQLFLLLKVHESSISLSAKHTKLKSTSKALIEFVRQSWCRLCSGVQEAGLLRVRAVLCPEFTGVVLLDLARDWYMDHGLYIYMYIIYKNYKSMLKRF